MKRLSLLLVLVLCLPLTARADEASRRVKAQEIVTLLHLDTLMQQMMDTVQKQASAMALQVSGDTPTPRQQALRDDFNKKAFALVESRMGWKAIESDILDLYARNFTDEELDAMLAFYKSPAGVSMIAKMPTISAQSSQIAQDRMTELTPELKQMVLDFAKSVKDVEPAVIAPGKSQPDASATNRVTPLVAGIANSRLEYARELDEIVDPATREKAADALVVYAKTHPDAQNHVAHVFASRNTHLDEALTLAQESVERVEKQTASIDIDHVSSNDFQTMEVMAEYWDSLGWVRYAQGDLKAAKTYCQIAWELGGEGLYIGHVAHIALDENDKTTAIRLFQIAMSGKMDDREKGQTASDLQKLGVDHPQAIVELTSIPVPAREVVPGSANFMLLFAGNQPPQVKWVSGDKSLTHFENAISQASFPPQSPDNGPEHMTRLGRMVCTQTACNLEMMFPWSELVVEAAHVRYMAEHPDLKDSGTEADSGTTSVDVGQPKSVGGGVSAPVVIKQVEPQFSEESRQKKMGGTVTVSIIVDATGKPQNVHVTRGVGMGLDEKAVEAVRQYRFTPAMVNGKPVAVYLNVNVNFQIIDKNWIIP